MSTRKAIATHQTTGLVDRVVEIFLTQLADGQWHQVTDLARRIPEDMADAQCASVPVGVIGDLADPREYGRTRLANDAVEVLHARGQCDIYDDAGRRKLRLVDTPAVKPAAKEWPVPATVPDQLARDQGPWDIKVDSEFAAIIPLMTDEEKTLLEANLIADGACRDPLKIWKGRDILLDGHARLPLCQEHGIPFEVCEIELPDRDAARTWIVRNQLGRRNLTPEQASYLRGKLYVAVKQSHGGNRGDARSSAQNEHLKTADLLASQTGVSAATIRRDADFAEAVDAVEAVAGVDAKHIILSGKSGVTRQGVLDLAAKKPAARKKAAKKLGKKAAKEPRTARPKTNAAKQSITVPRAPAALAQALLAKLGRRPAYKVYTALGKLLKPTPKPKNKSTS